MFQRSSTYIMSIKNGWDVLFVGMLSPRSLFSSLNKRSDQASTANAGLHDTADRLFASLRDLLDGLRSRGFQLNYGIHDAGPGLLVWSKGGGYYFGAYHYPSASNIYSESEITLGSTARGSDDIRVPR
jgi:hypothetical protein